MVSGSSSDGTSGTNALFSGPQSVAIDGSATPSLYIADTANNRIRKIIVSTGAVSTIAGSGVATATDGVGIAAAFCSPRGLALDTVGDNLYVADTTCNKIRVITLSNMAVSSPALVDGAVGGPAATLVSPSALALDSTNAFLYVTDSHRLRRVQLSNNVVTTLVGSTVPGSASVSAVLGTSASLNTPTHVVEVTLGGNVMVFIADSLNHCIRQYAVATMMVTVFAGSTSAVSGYQDGVGIQALFSTPVGLAVDGTTALFVSEIGTHRLRKIVLVDGMVSTVSGAGSAVWGDGVGVFGSHHTPRGLVFRTGNLFLAESGSHTIRVVQAVNSQSELRTCATGLLLWLVVRRVCVCACV